MIDSAEVAKLREIYSNGIGFGPTVIALLDALEEARKRIEEMREANAGMEAQRDSARAELEAYREAPVIDKEAVEAAADAIRAECSVNPRDPDFLAAGILALTAALPFLRPALSGSPAPDPAETMRAKCFDIVAVEMEAWREAAHTDDGDLYAQALAVLGVLKPISERIAALKDTALDTKDK